MLFLCSSAFAETKKPNDNGIDPQSTGRAGSEINEKGKIDPNSPIFKDKTPEEIEEILKKEKTKYPEINAVQNMYDMQGKIVYSRHYDNSVTNCAWTIAWAYKGTPYGQIAEEATAVDAQNAGWTGNINFVGQLMYVAAMNNQLITDVDPSELIWDGHGDLTDFGQHYRGTGSGYHPPSGVSGDRPYHNLIENYVPQPGDIAVTKGNSWYFGHVIMARPREDGVMGSIENGSGGSNNTNMGGGGIHTNHDARIQAGDGETGRDIVAWIRASDYANAVYPVGGGTPGGGGGSAYSRFVFGNIYDMGKSLSVIMEKFAELCEDVIERLLPAMIPLFWIMAIIDLAMTVMLAGFEINPFTVIVRFLKYGFFYFLIANWPELVDDFFLSFAFDTAGGTQVLTDSTVTMNITNPQLILQKGLLIIKPGIDYVSALSVAQTAIHIFACMMITAFSLITMLCLMVLAMYVAISYIEFYVVAALAVVCLPYTPSGFTKWIPQATIASVWKQTVKLFTLSIFIGLIGEIFANTTQADIIKNLAKYGMNMNESALQTLYSVITTNTQMVEALVYYGLLCSQIIMLCIVTFFISQKVADKLSPGSVIQW